jgi:hypothetical protein
MWRWRRRLLALVVTRFHTGAQRSKLSQTGPHRLTKIPAACSYCKLASGESLALNRTGLVCTKASKQSYEERFCRTPHTSDDALGEIRPASTCCSSFASSRDVLTSESSGETNAQSNHGERCELWQQAPCEPCRPEHASNQVKERNRGDSAASFSRSDFQPLVSASLLIG